MQAFFQVYLPTVNTHLPMPPRSSSSSSSVQSSKSSNNQSSKSKGNKTQRKRSKSKQKAKLDMVAQKGSSKVEQAKYQLKDTETRDIPPYTANFSSDESARAIFLLGLNAKESNHQNEKKLRQLFKDKCTIERLTFRANSFGTGYAFIQIAEAEKVDEIIQTFNGTYLDGKKLKLERKSVRPSFGSMPKEQIRSEKQCFRCGKVGHFIRDCTSAKVEGSRPRQPRGQSNKIEKPRSQKKVEQDKSRKRKRQDSIDQKKKKRRRQSSSQEKQAKKKKKHRQHSRSRNQKKTTHKSKRKHNDVSSSDSISSQESASDSSSEDYDRRRREKRRNKKMAKNKHKKHRRSYSSSSSSSR